ncbi:MAG: cation:proton antiporter [marine benthic group bacterium]|nr:cation:proton antiporter [Gemmatimonadota bacterium]
MASLLLGLAVVLLFLAVAGGASRWLGLSAIPAYILLGVFFGGPGLSTEAVHLIEAIGVALLLFFVGLEFSFLRLRSQARSLAAAGGIDLLVNFPVGLVAGLLLGWPFPASFLLGAALYISSSAIVAGNIAQLRRAAYPDTESALGILVAEDIIIAVILAGLALWLPIPGRDIPPAVTFGAIAGLLVILFVLGRPLCRVLDRIGERLENEALLLLVSGILLLFSGAALATGLSEAIGAFAAGLLVGDSSLKERVEGLLGPFQGLFAALFFFGFGLGIDEGALTGVWRAGLLISFAALASKLIGAWWIGARKGLSHAVRVNLGLTISPRGEFSILVASYGVAAGHAELRPLVAAVVIILAIAGSLLTQAGPRIGAAAARGIAHLGSSPL